MPRILFVADHRPGRSPNQRFRFEQYLGHLERNGFACDLSYLVEPGDDAFIYRPGAFLDKLHFVRRCYAKRRRDMERMNDFDLIFICRQAMMTRSTRFERAFRKSRARIVYDFDDAIWLPSVSEANRRFSFMKDPGKTARIIGLSDLVIAGNTYLADYARRFNPAVEVVPTTIDTDEYQPGPVRREGPVCIGWSGSLTTIQHFQYAIPALREVKDRFGDRVTFRVIGDGGFQEPTLGITGMPWRKETELDDLRAMDIGLMPLPDDDWARGKCGLKGLQYMALGIPTLMSPVGVNADIVTDGVNGFLPRTTAEWVERIARLVEDADLRARLGQAARRTVEERYSVHAWRDRYIHLFNHLLAPHGNRHRPQEDPAHPHP